MPCVSVVVGIIGDRYAPAIGIRLFAAVAMATAVTIILFLPIVLSLSFCVMPIPL